MTNEGARVPIEFKFVDGTTSLWKKGDRIDFTRENDWLAVLDENGRELGLVPRERVAKVSFGAVAGAAKCFGMWP